MPENSLVLLFVKVVVQHILSACKANPIFQTVCIWSQWDNLVPSESIQK